MNTSNESLNSTLGSNFPQNISLNNSSVGFEPFFSIIQKNIALLIIPASVILYLLNKLNGLNNNPNKNEREIGMTHKSIMCIFGWVVCNIAGYYYIFIIDTTFLSWNNEISTSWIILIIISLALAIRETISIFIKNCIEFIINLHKKIKKILHCILKT